VLEGPAQYAASRVRRFARWLQHPAIQPQHWYRPILLAALAEWEADQRVYVALDTTALTPFVLIRASLIYRRRANPLAWRVVRRASTKVGFEDYQPVLEQMHSLLPIGMVVILLADRGFVHAQLIQYTKQQHGGPPTSPEGLCRQGLVSVCWAGTLFASNGHLRDSHRTRPFGTRLPH
jgi:hypothetical protein